jgi:CelD/BcsL family acetyltransferase involved in cellulose biosynthesis
VATVYKLAHDQRLGHHSPGTVLTALMIEQLLDRDHAGEINLGPGADPYKRAWASRMREMQGILAFNRTTLRGRLGIARHIWGRGLKRAAGL